MKNIQEKFKIGDRVRVTCGTPEHDGKEGIVSKVNMQGEVTSVALKDDGCIPDSVELCKKTLADARKGDILVADLTGITCKVFANLEGLLFLSENNNYEELDKHNPYIASQLDGWEIKGEEPEEDTIEIEGKKYTVSEIKKALKV